MTARLSTFLSSSLALLLVATLALGTGDRLGAQIPGFDAGPDAQKVSIRTKVVPEKARPGEIVTLVATLEIIPTWHVYGRLQDPSLGTPTDLVVDAHGALERFGPALVPAGSPHEAYGLLTYHLEDIVELRQRFVVPVGTEPGAIALSGTVVYMACDATTCDDAKDESWSAKLEIEAGDAREEFAQDKVELLRAATGSGARVGEVVELEIELLVKDGFYIYGAKEPTGVATAVSLTDTGAVEKSGFEILPSIVPPGEEHPIKGLDESSFHLVGKVKLRQPFRVKAGAKTGTYRIKGKIDYQVCDEKSCDLPTSMEWTAEVAIEKGEARADRLTAPGGTTAQAGPAPSPGGLADAGLWQLILFAIGGGLFALAMPCTYPMIPITISFFTKQADARGGKVLPLALTYGFGIIAIFVLIGVIVGPVIVLFATHWITNLVIGVLFVVFALSLFGLFTLEPPRFLMNAAGKASNRGGYFGVFLMGATLVITSFTCTAPFVGNVLALGAQGGQGVVAIGMAVFGLTMAVPFVALALVPGAVSNMPNSGQWMNTLKVFLGFVEVAAALKFISNVDRQLDWELLPRELYLWLWAAIFGAAAMFLLGKIRFKGETGEIGPGRLVGGLTVLLLAVYFACGAAGNQLDRISESIAPPYSKRMAWAEGVGGAAKRDAWTIVKDDFDEALRLAKSENKKLFLNFTGIT